MKTIYKILAVTLLTAMLLSSFASCQTNTPTTDTTPTTTPAETLPETPASPIKLVENGQSAFKVVIPKYSTYAEKVRIEKFVNSFKSKTGVELVMIDDEDALYGNTDFEVLIGHVARKESEDIAAQLRNNEYFYGVVGNKLVIIGKESVDLEDAIQFFLRKVIDMAADKSNITLDPANNYFHKYDFPIDNLLIGNTPVYNYSIVYSKTDSHAASVTAAKIANLILSFTGFEIPVIADTKDATPYEIVIGNTERGTPSTASRDMFSVNCKEEKLYLASGLAVGYDMLYDYLQKTFSRASDETLTFENGFSYQESIAASLSGGTENMVNKGGNIRAMFHNVLVHDRENARVTWRAKYALDVYRDYAPDVIGLQEMENSNRTAIATGLKKMGYIEVSCKATNYDASKYSQSNTIFYNPETLTLIASGAWKSIENLDFEIPNWAYRISEFAIFEEKATGKRFCVISVHYTWVEDFDRASICRIYDAQGTVALIDYLVNNYGEMPLILGGDFNSDITTSAYGLLKAKNLKDVELLATKTEDMNTHHSEPVFDIDTKLCTSYYYPVGGSDQAIDHILAYNDKNVTFNTYDVITDPFALATSDHCPLLVDFTLN